jgi:hypothetical protein
MVDFGIATICDNSMRSTSTGGSGNTVDTGEYEAEDLIVAEDDDVIAI